MVGSHIRFIVGVAVMVALTASVAWAQAPSGAFVSGSGGFAYREPAEDAAAKNWFDPGWNFNVAGGYRFPGAIRLEGEFTMFRNNFNETSLFNNGVALPREQSEGAARGQSLLFSAYYDVPTEHVRPYVGAGIGTYRVDLDKFTTPTLRSFGVVVDQTTSWKRVAQVRAGVAFPIGEQTELWTGYRWHRGFPLQFVVPGVGELHPGGARTHSGEVGIRVFFGS